MLSYINEAKYEVRRYKSDMLSNYVFARSSFFKDCVNPYFFYLTIKDH